MCKRKSFKYIFVFLFICNSLSGSNYSKEKIGEPDIQDKLYSFSGTWKIEEIFELNPLFINDIYNSNDAFLLQNKKIQFTENEILFQDDVYHIKKIATDIYYTSEELAFDTHGSYAVSYDFSKLRLPDNIKKIRYVVLYTEEEYDGIPFFGTSFFVTGNNTILIHWRGWIFKAVRIK